MKLNIIAAMCKLRGIGYKNALPWSFKTDMQYFTRQTIGYPNVENNAVIMGKNTWHSLPRPLKQRKNLVLSSTMRGDFVYSDMESCIEYCKQQNFKNVWIIGGQEIYTKALQLPIINKLYITEIAALYKCDTIFPFIPGSFELVNTTHKVENGVGIDFHVYENKNNC